MTTLRAREHFASLRRIAELADRQARLEQLLNGRDDGKPPRGKRALTKGRPRNRNADQPRKRGATP